MVRRILLREPLSGLTLLTDIMLRRLLFILQSNNRDPRDISNVGLKEFAIAGKKRSRFTKGPPKKKTAMAPRLRPIGVIRSTLKTRSEAPKQASEGAPDAWLEVSSFAAQALEGLSAGDNIIVITWLHHAKRDVLKVHPRSDPRRRLAGVFATRSPDRPNPLGLHYVKVRRISKNRLRVGPLEAIDGTPVVDIKPVLSGLHDF